MYDTAIEYIITNPYAKKEFSKYKKVKNLII